LRKYYNCKPLHYIDLKLHLETLIAYKTDYLNLNRFYITCSTGCE
jgi:hypothetical protein